MPNPRKRQKRAVGGSADEDSCVPEKEISSKAKAQTSMEDAGTQAARGLMQELTDDEWKAALQAEMEKDYFKRMAADVINEYQSTEVFPPKELIFNALNLTPLNKVKVVLLGQDPYHDNGQAMGLAFSVPHGIAIPPSLRNMFTELSNDIQGFKAPKNGCLEKWARQGVLLLNATLTVKAHNANSHSKLGWQTFTDSIIKLISEKCDGVVFMLWGGFAHKKEKLIDSKKHTILKDSHPSPLSFGKFKGCKCFSRANVALNSFGKSEIDWTL